MATPKFFGRVEYGSICWPERPPRFERNQYQARITHARENEITKDRGGSHPSLDLHSLSIHISHRNGTLGLMSYCMLWEHFAACLQLHLEPTLAYREGKLTKPSWFSR